MEIKDKELSPEESMQIITQSLSNFKRNYREKSDYVLLWGYVIALASLTHFAVLRYLISNENYTHISLISYLIWGGFVLGGIILQFFKVARSKDRTLTVSQLDRHYRLLWYVAATAIFIIAFICLKFEIYPAPFILTIIGFTTMTSGLFIRFKPLIIGGIIFFAFSILMAFVVNEYQLLLNTIAIVAGYIIPGYMLRKAKE